MHALRTGHEWPVEHVTAAVVRPGRAPDVFGDTDHVVPAGLDHQAARGVGHARRRRGGHRHARRAAARRRRPGRLHAAAPAGARRWVRVRRRDTDRAARAPPDLLEHRLRARRRRGRRRRPAWRSGSTCAKRCSSRSACRAPELRGSPAHGVCDHDGRSHSLRRRDAAARAARARRRRPTRFVRSSPI